MSESTLKRLNGNLGGLLGGDNDDKIIPDPLNRYAGGARKITPYISGYWYVAFILPAGLFNKNKQRSELWLTSAAEGFTPHSRVLSKVELPGMGGMGSSFASGQQITRQFSITFGEYQNLPIYNTIRQWTAMFDEQEGAALIKLNASVYKGTAHVFLAKPQVSGKSCVLKADDIEEYYGYDGVWPETTPTDALASDIATNDRAMPSIQFNFDGNPLTRTDGVLEDALKQISNGLSSFNKTKSRLFNATTPVQ